MYEKIPNELKNLKQWCCYKITPDEARVGKFKKLPVNACTGGNAQSNNEQTWSDFDTAVQAVDKLKLDGIGFFFANGYFGVDIDNASDLIADYKLGEENLISEFIHSLQSYSELSVSKTGIHIICKGKLPPKGRRKGNVEMYQQGRFFIMTGNQISEYTDISECTETIKSLHEKYIGGGTEPQAVVVRSNDLDMSEKEIIELASKSKQGPFFIDLLNGNWQGFFTSQSEADISFCNMLAFWTSCDYNKMDGIFRSSGLMREKWERRQANSTYGAITLNKAISGCTDVYTPSEQYAIQINEDKQKSKPRKLYSMDDTGNAERLFDSFKDSLRYSYINKGWIYYDGRKWCVDDTGMIKRATDDILQLMRKDTDLYSNGDEEVLKAFNKHLKTSRSSNSKNAMANELKHKLPILPEQLDKNSFLLNTPNGELNLKNGELKNHDVNDFITKITNVEYTDKMEPTRWIQFLNEIFDNDQDLIKYMQKAVGYSLTGDTTEQCCFFCFGTGKNGKSVFLETVTSILGDYASNIQPESIMIKNVQSSASSDIARLKGSRFVTSEEPNEGVRLNEGLVKQLTGSDKVTARHLYGNEFEFRPEFKLWIGTNHKPIIRGTDTGIWRRLHLIPFKVQIPDDKVDKNLKHKLIQEYPAILKWCIDGALIWQKEGLKKPLAVEESTKEYRQEMDVISSFLDECTTEGYQYHTSAAELYNSYKQWADENNEYKFTNSKFGREVSKRYEKTRRSGGNYYVGIKVTNVYNVKIG